MGLIRKTFSVATLGLVNWRSKNERIQRLADERDRAVDLAAKMSRRQLRALEREQKAGRRAKKAELDALGAAKKAESERRRSVGADNPVVSVADAAVTGGRRARRKAKKKLKKATDTGRLEARDLKRAAQRAASKAEGAVDRVTSEVG